MGSEDIEQAQKEAELHADEDKKKRESVEARNVLENSIYQAEKMPSEYKDKITADDKKAIETAVAAAKKVKEDDKAGKDELEKAAKELQEAIMPNSARPPSRMKRRMLKRQAARNHAKRTTAQLRAKLSVATKRAKSKPGLGKCNEYIAVGQGEYYSLALRVCKAKICQTAR